MKKFLALFVICCMLMTTLASCNLIDKILGRECTEHIDENGDLICDNCGADVPAPEPPVCEEHKDEDGDEKCDVCGADVPAPEPPVCEEHKDEDGDEKCDVCGADVPAPEPPVCEEHKDEDGDEKCDVCGADVPTPEPPVCEEHKDEDGDEKCDVCGADVPAPEPPVCEEHKDEDGDYACDECGYVMFETVSYNINISDLEANVRSEDDINGKFTIVSGTEVRNRTKTFTDPDTGEKIEFNKSVKIGGNAHMIKISVPGTGKLRFIIQNGSSGVDMQYTKVIAPDGTVHDIEFVAGSQSNPLVVIEIDVTEGEWTIARGKNGGTQDIYYLELDCVVAVAPENGFELVSTGKVDFLANEELVTSGVRLNATYENGKTNSLDLSLVNIDTGAVDMTKSGSYTVTITYKNYAPITYTVNVYAPESLKLGFDAIEKLAQNSSAGNGVYFNHSFKELYFVGDTLDTSGLSVIVTGKCGEDTLEFRRNDYEITGFDSSSAGAKTLTVSCNGVEATVTVYVTDVLPTADEDGAIKALVDPSYEGSRGAIIGSYHVFNTIQQALDFLEGADAATSKVLSIAAGYYNEKLEITIPNLTVQGMGEKPEDVVIEWNSLYGLVDDGGFTHTTDSTATVAVREQAVNCRIENLTISNYWNSQERMDEAGLAIERGLALLVQADRFIMKDGRLLGIQDTLELFTGRQYFENVYISGYTDFVFGTNNTTYFKNCTIHVIDTEKDDKGTAGYLTAFKGSNKGADDAIVYGAIFDGCKFTADEGVTAGCTAIGRPWGAYAAVAVINSELGGHISVKGYETSKNERYVSMNAKPTDSTVQYVEYNNTGDGAITEAVAGMRMLTAEEAALYADFATIFGTSNGNVSYLDPWDPSSNDVQIDDRDYYYFTTETSSTGTNHSFDTSTVIESGATLEWDGLLISAENGNVAWNQNSGKLNMKKGAFIKFNVEAGTTVTVTTHSGYGYYTLNGVGTSHSTTFSKYYAEATEVVLMSTGDLYLSSIIIDPNSEAPEAPALSEIKASGMNVNYTVGTEVSLEGLLVNAYYSDNSIIPVTDYSVDTSAVDFSAEGAYDVVITYGGKSYTVTVNYEDPNAGPEISKDTLLDFSTTDGLEAVQNNPKVTITGSVRHNGGEIQISGTISFQVKAGTVVVVTPYGNSSYASYTIGEEGAEDLATLNTTSTFFATKDCTVVYTGLSNNYLVSINVLCPLSSGTYVFGGKDMEGDVTGILASVPGLSISGTCKSHSGGAQLGQDSVISFTVPAFANVSIKGFDTSYGQLEVLVGGEAVAMNDNACYVFSTVAPALVTIKAVNVGTEDSPAYNKSYITAITLSVREMIEESVTINFGTSGNYSEITALDMSGMAVRDNGENNSQLSSGSMSFAVKAGATVTVHGYSGYTSYTLSDGTTTTSEITDSEYTYTATSDVEITITAVSSNNYFYGIDIAY